MEQIQIKKYNPKVDFEKLMKVIESEGEEWNCYSSNANREKYQNCLSHSITYVAYWNDVLCGYSRSVDGFGFDIYVCDLLVHESYRGHDIGKRLMECLTVHFPKRKIYVMSDVDDYYHKLGYKKIGSIFEVGY